MTKQLPPAAFNDSQTPIASSRDAHGPTRTRKVDAFSPRLASGLRDRLPRRMERYRAAAYAIAPDPCSAARWLHKIPTRTARAGDAVPRPSEQVFRDAIASWRGGLGTGQRRHATQPAFVDRGARGHVDRGSGRFGFGWRFGARQAFALGWRLSNSDGRHRRWLNRHGLAGELLILRRRRVRCGRAGCVGFDNAAIGANDEGWNPAGTDFIFRSCGRIGQRRLRSRRRSASRILADGRRLLVRRLRRRKHDARDLFRLLRAFDHLLFRFGAAPARGCIRRAYVTVVALSRWLDAD